MSRVLVTGAGGFLGRHVLQPLMEHGCEVHAVSRQPVSDARSAAVQWHTTDLFAPSQVETLLRTIRPMGLIHFAWNTTPGEYWHSSENLTWTAASLRLLGEFARHGGRRAVLAGSSAEYTWGGTEPLDERTSRLQPISLYGCTKNSLRQIVESWANVTDLSWAWGRIFNIFGPHERPQRLVPRVIRALQRQEHLSFDEGLARRDFLYVEDAARAFVSLFLSEVQGAVNIASGQDVTIRHVISCLAEHVDALHLVSFGSIGQIQNEPEVITAAVERLRHEVGWKHEASLDDRLRETSNWWRAASS